MDVKGIRESLDKAREATNDREFYMHTGRAHGLLASARIKAGNADGAFMIAAVKALLEKVENEGAEAIPAPPEPPKPLEPPKSPPPPAKKKGAK